jgi:hypothetical protein
MKTIKEKEIRDYLDKNSKSYGLILSKKELNIAGLQIDIFGIDRNHIPYIFEIKKGIDRHIIGQTMQYYFTIKTHEEEIMNKINFYDIKWDKLSVICLAKEFFERDFKAVEDPILKEIIHLYNFNITTNSRDDIFSLDLVYVGPNEKDPLNISSINNNSNNIIQLHKHYSDIKSKALKKDFFVKNIKYFLEEVGEIIKKDINIPLFSHISYYPTDYYLRVGTSSKTKHRASIIIIFTEKVFFGFDLTHSLQEGKKLATFFDKSPKIDSFCTNTFKLDNYRIYIPNTGFHQWLNINLIEHKALTLLLKSYNPSIMKDCYFGIYNEFTDSFMSVNDAAELIRNEYIKFQYIFDILQK